MSQMKLVVGAVIVDSLDRPTRLLAARRSRPAELAGWWEFPGGKAEDGEKPEDALVREVREELAVDIRMGPEIRVPEEAGARVPEEAGARVPEEGRSPVSKGPSAWTISSTLELRLFLVEITQGEPTPTADHDKVRWLGFDELEAVEWLPADAAALEAVRRTVGG